MSFAFHVSNAHEDDQGRVILEAVDYDEASFNAAWTGLGGVADVVRDPVGAA